MRRGLRIVTCCVGFLLLVPQAASAAWGGAGVGTGRSKADVLPVGPTPSLAVSGHNVTVSWSGLTFANGQPVGSYRVARYPAAGGAADSIAASCAGTITALSCTEASVPTGSWRYGVTAVRGAWTGVEGAPSAVATVGAPAFTFSASATLLALPAVKAGALTDFVTGESVVFRLDSTSGPVLAGSTTPGTIGFSGAASVLVTIPAGTSEGPHTVYAMGSLGSTANATIQVDLQAPVISSAIIGKTQGGTTGLIRQGGSYYVYANVTDAGSSVSTVFANVSTVSPGTVAAPLTAGSYTAGGVAYGYRSAVLTANNPLAAGSKAFSLTATDANAHVVTTGGFSVVVDNTAPAGTNVQAPNSSGGIVGRAETGDSVIATFTEPIEANSIVAGWDGLTSQSVTLRLIQNGGGDRVQIWNATNTVRLPLGQIRLGGTGYTATTVNFTGSTMTMSGAAITIVLGTPSGAVTTAAAVSTMQWTPSAAATDRAANPCATTRVGEPPAADAEF